MPLTSHQPVTVFSLTPPFQITRAVGEDLPEDSYYVKEGVCFSSFSFDTGTFVPIKGLGTGENYQLTDNKKLYIDIDILPNLQVSGAQVKCTEVNTDEYWKNYPDMIEIKPEDETDEDGRVTKLVDNKVQTKCYVLIGYNQNDASKNGDSNPINQNLSSTPVQILDTNIILLASVVKGVPVVFPSPYLNGQAHVNAIQKS